MQGVNTRYLAFASIGVLLMYRILGAIFFYVKERSFKTAMLQFCDVLVFKEVLVSHQKYKRKLERLELDYQNAVEKQINKQKELQKLQRVLSNESTVVSIDNNMDKEEQIEIENEKNIPVAVAVPADKSDENNDTGNNQENKDDNENDDTQQPQKDIEKQSGFIKAEPLGLIFFFILIFFFLLLVTCDLFVVRCLCTYVVFAFFFSQIRNYKKNKLSRFFYFGNTDILSLKVVFFFVKRFNCFKNRCD